MPRLKKDSPTDFRSTQPGKSSELSSAHKIPTPAFTMTTRRKAAMASNDTSPNESGHFAQSSSSPLQSIIVPRRLDLPASTITSDSSVPIERTESRGRKRNQESSASSQPTPSKVLASSLFDHSENPTSKLIVNSSELVQSKRTSRSSPAKRLSSMELPEPPPNVSEPAHISTALASQEVHRSISSTPDEHHSDLFSPPSMGELSTDIDEEEQAALEAEQADADYEDRSTPAPVQSSEEEDVGELGELPEDEQDDDVSISPDYMLERSKPSSSMYSIIAIKTSFSTQKILFNPLSPLISHSALYIHMHSIPNLA